MLIKKFVITGGPCGGKTTAIEWIKKHFGQKGYHSIVVPETATQLISSGVEPWKFEKGVDYQRLQMTLQLEKEKIYERAAQTLQYDKILMILDRGMLDNKVYMTAEEFHLILEEMELTEKELLDRYDAVFHLVTAAKGAESFYTTANNAARTETVEQASAMDDHFIEVWSGHLALQIIDNSVGFEEKMQRLIQKMEECL